MFLVEKRELQSYELPRTSLKTYHVSAQILAILILGVLNTRKLVLPIDPNQHAQSRPELFASAMVGSRSCNHWLLTYNVRQRLCEPINV